MKRHAFSLVELLVVIAIIAVLTAILLPVFWIVRGKARQTTCVSNLHQIGVGVQMYLQDYDGRFPYAVDPSDRLWPSTWSSHPAFQGQIPNLPYIQDSLKTYTASTSVFSCSGDMGFLASDFTGEELNAFPTSFQKFGTSYYYRTEVAAGQVAESALSSPGKINLIFDGAGHWHGTLIPIQRRYNVLFADAHVKNINSEQMNEAWFTPLTNRN